MAVEAFDEERIRTLVGEVVNDPHIRADEDIVARGLLDSLALVELLTQIEREFDLAIPFDELDLEELRTVNRIARLLARWRGAGEGTDR